MQRNNRRRPVGGNFNAYNSNSTSEYPQETSSPYPQSYNNTQRGFDPRIHGSKNYTSQQQTLNPHRSWSSGSGWNENNDLTHTRPYFSKYSRLPSRMQSFQANSNYYPRERYTRDDLNMTNQFNSSQINSYSNQFSPFNYTIVGSNQYGASENEIQEHMPCEDGNTSLAASTGKPTTKIPSYIITNNWLQAGVTVDDVETEVSLPKTAKIGKVNKHVGGLMKGLSQPVEADKAQRMMTMMGWQGGALGCNRDGLTEPLRPNLLLQKGAGLGHKPPDPAPLGPDPAPRKPNIPRKPATGCKNDPVMDLQKKNPLNIQKKQEISTNTKKKGNKNINNKIKQEMGRGLDGEEEPDTSLPGRGERGGAARFPDMRPALRTMRRQLPKDLQTDILNKILGFVSDPKQDEIAFPKTLTRHQRAYIHFLMNGIRKSNGVLYRGRLDSEQQAKIIEEICECNGYVLTAKSDGVGENRQLYLYKEPPDHMFLITRDDLTDCPGADDENDDEDIGNCEVITLNDDSDDDNEIINETHRDVDICDTIDEKNDVLNEECDDRNVMNNNNTAIFTESTIHTSEGRNEKYIHNSEHNVDNNSMSLNNTDVLETDPKVKIDSNTEDTKIEIDFFKNKLKIDSNGDNQVKNHPISKIREEFKIDQIDEDTVKVNTDPNPAENDPKENKTISERKEQIRKLLLKYFKEFFEDTKYTEMRFLGNFDELEESAIVSFVIEIGTCIDDIDNCKNLIKEGDNWLVPLFSDETFKLMTMANTDGYSDNIIEKFLRKNSDDDQY